MSHRGKEFIAIAQKAEADLRRILGIPATYKVLFLQGGASLQFAMVPLNLLGDKGRADYIHTGEWSKKAIGEAKRHGQVSVAADAASSKYTHIPAQSEWRLDPGAAYVHYTPNETIGGVEFHWVPETGDVPLVADMSSTILSRPIDVTRFGVIYAGAQKNIGPAGLTIAIVREDLIGRAGPNVPAMLNYKTQADNESMYNTPPTYAWYVAGLVLEWIDAQGGVTALADLNRRKADKLYRAIDASEFYRNPVAKDCRSWMNVPFTLADPALDDAFLKGAKAEGLVTLKGHRSVGGMRASIYNAMPEAGVDALVQFMAEFERTRG
jgi:phosphoserine aminotransferase